MDEMMIKVNQTKEFSNLVLCRQCKEVMDYLYFVIQKMDAVIGDIVSEKLVPVHLVYP